MPASDHSAFPTRSPFARARFALTSWAASQVRTLALVGATAALALGCTPKIGDSCTVSTNCSATGDRLCDITQPGGYCTIFNCEPGTCPEDSVCINFGSSLSSVGSGECSVSQGTSPYQRSFCMATCGSNGDCRGGYSCLSLKGDVPNALGAVLVDSGDGKVCVVAPHDAPSLAVAETGGTAGESAGAGVDSAGEGGESASTAGTAGYKGVETGVCDGYNGGGSSGGAAASGN